MFISFVKKRYGTATGTAKCNVSSAKSDSLNQIKPLQLHLEQWRMPAVYIFGPKGNNVV